MSVLKLLSKTLLFLCLWIAIPVSIKADVLTVGTAGDYSTITDALMAATDGDILLVEPGSHASFVVDNIGVSVIADSGGTIRTTKVTVRNIAAHQTVVLAGLSCTVSPFPPAAKTALTLENNAGSIRCEDCWFTGVGFPNGDPGARISLCNDVAFIRCTVKGGGGWANYPCGGHGGRGMESSSSMVTLYDCFLSGGAGGVEAMAAGCDGGDGGNALHAYSSFVFASGSEFKGGNGAYGTYGDFGVDPGDGGDGGDGIYLCYPSVAWLLDNITSGGDGGPGGVDYTGGPPGASGKDGEDVNAIPSMVHYMLETAHHLEITSPAREGETIQIVFTGEVGDHAVLLFSAYTEAHFIQGLRGVFLLPLSPFPLVLGLGPLNASGTLTVPVIIPELGLNIAGIRIHTQSYFWNSSGMNVMGTAQTIFLLDAGF